MSLRALSTEVLRISFNILPIPSGSEAPQLLSRTGGGCKLQFSVEMCDSKKILLKSSGQEEH